MFEHQKTPLETDLVARVMGIFPAADAVIVSALMTQSDALQRYLAQANQLTRGEAGELLGAFMADWRVDVELRAAG